MFEDTAIYKFLLVYRMITGRTDIFGIVKHENYQTEY